VVAQYTATEESLAVWLGDELNHTIIYTKAASSLPSCAYCLPDVP
jgi:hypothetical protein